MTPLDRLTALGTSVWIDGLVPAGALARLVSAGVTGLTSNPTIFRTAVLEAGRYADRIARLGTRHPLEHYEALAIEDVQAAADVLARVFARTRGADGFVSLEVAPDLADDVAGTVAAARRLWARVDRPNIMIKIPATIAGVEATRRATADGINVNANAAVLGRALRRRDRRLPGRARGTATLRAAD
jgi:transaldolase